MSLPGTNGLEIVHIPQDGGEKVWVYDDIDNVKIGGKETGGALTLVEVDFGPGAGPPPHVHANEHESIYVVDGTVDILDGERSFTTGTGSFIFMPKGSHHAFRNTGTGMAKVLLLFTPAGFEGYMTEFGQPYTEGSSVPPTDEELALRLATKYGMSFVDVPPGVWD